MEGLISINGKVAAPDQCSLSPFDRGFLYGDAIVEVWVAFGSKILNLDEHLDRLWDTAEACSIDLPWGREALAFELQTLVDHCRFPKSMVRVEISRGTGLGLRPNPVNAPTKVIYCLPAPPDPSTAWEQGVSLKRRSLGYTQRDPQHKSTGYQRSINALVKANAEGFDDVLWVNSEQEVTEATAANIFLIGREGDLVEIATPGVYSGILPGITRANLMRLLHQARIPVTERVIATEEMARFDEGFLCSTVRGLIPIQRIDSQKLHSTRPQAVFHHIRRLYATWVQTEVGYKVDLNTGERLK